MELKNAKTCNGCKASWYESRPLVYHCGMTGFKCSSSGVPAGPCPKPNTNAKYAELNIAISRGDFKVKQQRGAQ